MPVSRTGLRDAIGARIVTFNVHVSAKDIPRYQVFFAGMLACRLKGSEAAKGQTGR